MKLKFHRNFYDDDTKVPLFEKGSIELEPGLTILVGCNGSGKSTLLSITKEYCITHKIPHLMLNTISAGSDVSQMFLDIGHIDELAMWVTSSEGERIGQSIAVFVTTLNRFVRESYEKGEPEVCILIDSVDSGFSLDNIVEIKRHLLHRILDEYENMHIYIIVSANIYEVAKNERCLLLPDMKYKEIKSYEEFRKLIVRSRCKKNKRYKWPKFEDDE